MASAFCCPNASLTGATLSVKRMRTVEAASRYMRTAIARKDPSAACCLVVPNALSAMSHTAGYPHPFLNDYCGLPPKFDVSDIRMSDVDTATSTTSALGDVDAEIYRALALLGRAHRASTGDALARARVTRVSGTPCPKAHVDRLRLRIIATLRGPGVVLYPEDHEPVFTEGERHEIATNQGDVVFMRGVSNEDHANGRLGGGILHRSPARKWWMSDRVIVQVDDW